MSDFQSNIHKPQKFNAYFKVHESYLEQFREEGLVLKDSLHTYKVPGTPFWKIEAEIWLRGNLRMTVEKRWHISRTRWHLCLHDWLDKLGKDVGVTVRNNVFASKEKIQLTLYVLGNQKDRAEQMVAQLFSGDSSKYDLTVVDVLEDAQAAKHAKITATPCLVKESPGARAVFVGDISAASIRWQLSMAEQHAKDARDTAQDLRQAKQDHRDIELDKREQRQDQRDLK